MKTRIHRGWRVGAVCLALWGGCLSLALGQTIGLGNLWDLSGSYTEDLDGFEFVIQLVQDSKGKVTGTANWSASEEGITMHADVTIKGRVKSGADGRAVVKLKFKHKGLATDGDVVMKFSATQRMEGVVDAGTRSMTGSLVTAIKMRGMREKFEEYYEEELETDMDGTAELVLAVTGDDRGRLSGTATCTLSNGGELAYLLKGKLRNDVDKLALKGDKLLGNAGSKIKLELNEGGDVLAIKGKVMGQKLDMTSLVVTPP